LSSSILDSVVLSSFLTMFVSMLMYLPCFHLQSYSLFVTLFFFFFPFPSIMKFLLHEIFRIMFFSLFLPAFLSLPLHIGTILFM
jgi:hypothetical protein